MVKSWFVVIGVFSALMLTVYVAHRKHDSWILSALLAAVALVFSVAGGERIYRFVVGRDDSNVQGRKN